MTFKRAQRQAVLEHLVGKNDIGALPTRMALALFTAAPSAAGAGGTEVSNANGYSRTAYAGTKWDSATAAEPSVIDNASEEVIGPASGGNWGTIVGVGLMESSTHGADDLIAYFDLASDIVINDGDSLRLPAGNLSASLA